MINILLKKVKAQTKNITNYKTSGNKAYIA